MRYKRIEAMYFLVVDCAFNKRYYPELIGEVFLEPHEYARTAVVSSPGDIERELAIHRGDRKRLSIKVY